MAAWSRKSWKFVVYDFSISQGIFKISHFYGRRGQDGRTSSQCQISSKSLDPRPRYGDFSKMAAVRHLGFVMRVWGPPTMAFGGLCHCVKFGWNRCTSFDNMYVFWFREFGLKTPIHAPTNGLGEGGVSTPHVNKFQKGTSQLRESAPRLLSHHAWKSVDASDL